MKVKVVNTQKGSKDCIVCGLESDSSLKAVFYELEDKQVVTRFKMAQFHQSYPGRAHGGMICAILDEVVGRAVKCYDPDCWGVTVDINIKYTKPTPLDVELLAVGRITSNRSRVFKGTGELYLPNGDVAASIEATYVKLSSSKISADENLEEIWRDVKNDNTPEYFEIPEQK